MLHRPVKYVPQYNHQKSTAAHEAKAQAIRAIVKDKTKGFLEQKEALLKPKEEPSAQPQEG